MPNIGLMGLLFCSMLVLTGCAGPSPEREAEPTIAIETMAGPMAAVMETYQADLRRELRRRLAGRKGYPIYAALQELQGDVRLEVISYGWADRKITVAETYGDDAFQEHAVMILNEAISRTFMPKELRAGNYKYAILVSYRL